MVLVIRHSNNFVLILISLLLHKLRSNLQIQSIIQSESQKNLYDDFCQKFQKFTVSNKIQYLIKQRLKFKVYTGPWNEAIAQRVLNGNQTYAIVFIFQQNY
ncbi:unnamed protein product [Paramecium sonneborni]|uniref:Transmembrane protein n=1 Tax=Paramecium sonneborni TaxID=65129 RepID=A0A8S1P5V2_9CILI|nr:unnamed protein product [Paramecium sonneborni]